MKKPLLYAGAFAVGGGLALGAISLLDKPEQITQVAETEQQPEVLLKSRVVPREEFTKVGRLDDEFDLFQFQSQQGEGIGDASNRFDNWDLRKGDRYKDTGTLNVVDEQGNPVRVLLLDKPGYIRARPKIRSQIHKSPPVNPTPPPVTITNPEAFAVLINNDPNETRHIGNLRRAYHTLRASGVDPCNIYVVSSANENTECNQRSLGVNQEGNSLGLRAALSELKKRIDSNDLLLIYTTGHGSNGRIDFSRSDGFSYSELRRFRDITKPNLVFAVSDACFGGGIVDRFRDSPDKGIALSPTDSSSTTICDLWTPYFWDGLRYNLADFDRNGVTSLREAFFRASVLYDVTLQAGNLLPSEAVAEVTGMISSRNGNFYLDGVELTFPPQLFATTGGIYDATLDGRILNRPEVRREPPRVVSRHDGRVVELTPENYYREVIQSDIPVFIDVYTTWCGACKFLARQIEEIKPRYAGRIKFAKIDYESPGAEATIARHTPVEVYGFPTIILVERGRPRKLDVGGVPHARDLDRILATEFSLR